MSQDRRRKASPPEPTLVKPKPRNETQVGREALTSTRRDLIVLRASNGKEAIVHLDRTSDAISLIVCDLNMPECDGIEVILELGRRRTQIPVVIVTRAVPAVVKSAEILARIHGIKILNLLIKPVHFQQLTSTLDAALAASFDALVNYDPARPAGCLRALSR